MLRTEDALELLLPQAEAGLMNRARDITHFLRLLSDDAVSARAASVGIDWNRARTELEQHDIRRLVRGITDLLRHHVDAVAAGESFSWHGEPALEVQDAWRLLNEFRDELPWIAGVPAPDEAALSVAERLLESLVRLEVSEAEIALWRARLARWSEGVGAAERQYRRELERGAREARHPATVRALVGGVAACLLDRGAVREARSWLTQDLAAIERDAYLRHLLAWTRLVAGDFQGAKRTLLGSRPWSGTLPRALFELRALHPEWLPCLAGRAPPAEPDACPPRVVPLRRVAAAGAIRSRADVGAAALCVFEFRPGRGTRALVTDVAPALRTGLDDWLRDREDAWSVSSELEHRCVVSARAIRVEAEAELGLPTALGRETTRALALVPILDVEGEVGGWLHMEFEHHLLPSAPRSKILAEAWSSELVRIRAGNENALAAATAAGEPPDEPSDERAEGLCAGVFRCTILDLGVKTSQRRWWGFSVRGGVAREVAAGGDGIHLGLERRGERRALRRAVLTGGSVVFDEPAPKLAILADAGSGVALPLLAAGRVCGVLVLESSRRHDFRANDLERYAPVLDRAGLALRLAQFRTWHQAEFGFDVWFDAARPDFQMFAHNLLAAARSRAPVVLFGPAGTGKLILTRWLHFESEGVHEPIRVQSCGRGTFRGGLPGMLQAVRGGSLVLDDVDDFDPALQEELLRWMEGVDAAGGSDPEAPLPDMEDDAQASRSCPPRVFATTRVGLVEAARSGKLRHDLALRLNRLELRVPALKNRREDVLPLIQCLAQRFAAEEQVALPSFTDEALALLWRQPWEGNVRELENVVYKLVLLHRSVGGRPRMAIDPGQVARIASSFELELTRKLNSRHPVRSDLLAALRVTRMNAGRINKTRAAQYLGWDPDTLVARMDDLGIHDPGDLDPSAWVSAPPDQARIKDASD